MARRHPNVVNVSEVDASSRSKGSRFGMTSKILARVAGARGIGCSWYEVPAGKTAFPAHWHGAMEEAIFVLEGKGRLRIGEEHVTVGAGDWITLPAGPDHAHQLVNDGDAPLRYLCMSTLPTTEVVGYPDSGKVGVVTMANAEDFMTKPWLRGMFRGNAQVDYYDGEEID